LVVTGAGFAVAAGRFVAVTAGAGFAAGAGRVGRLANGARVRAAGDSRAGRFGAMLAGLVVGFMVVYFLG
jgi:hypothetical protein